MIFKKFLVKNYFIKTLLKFSCDKIVKFSKNIGLKLIEKRRKYPKFTYIF